MMNDELKKALKTCGKSWFVEAFPFMYYNMGVVSDDVLTEDLSIAIKRDYSDKSAYMRFQAAKKILNDGPQTIINALTLASSKDELKDRCNVLIERVNRSNIDV